MFNELMKIECRVTFKFLGKYVGTAEFYSHRIEIDLTGRDNIAMTFLHELIHLARPRWGEKRVLLTEKRLWKKLTHRQVARLYAKLYRDARRTR